MKIDLPENYIPSEQEEYMNPMQVCYFKNLLLKMKKEIQEQQDNFLFGLKENSYRKADPLDMGAAHGEMMADFSKRKRQKEELTKIEYGLSRIAEEEYGYCEETGDEIGLRRLLARPTATLCIEAQETMERMAGLSSIMRGAPPYQPMP